MKKLFVILCLTAICCSFAGCGETAADSQEKAGNLTIIDKGQLNCSSDEGYYYIGQDQQMMYMDYKTKKEVYLCNRPGCKHDTESCPAVFSDEELAIGSSLFYYDGYLYLFSHEPDQSGASSVDYMGDGSSESDQDSSFNSKPATLYRMKPDGTEREKVFTFDEGLSVEDQVLADENALYFITKKVSTENVDNQTTYYASSERTMLRVDMKSWKASTTCKLDEDVNIIGCIDDKLVIEQLVFDHKLSRKDMLDNDKYIDAYKKSHSSFLTLDISSGKTVEFLKLSNDKINTYAVGGNSLFFSTEGEQKIKSIDVKTKKEKTLAETESNCIDDIYDDALCCSSWESVNGEKTDRLMYFVSLDDGEIEKSSLHILSLGWNIEIKAELKDQFLVVYDYDAKADTMFGNEQYEIRGKKYGLIDRKSLYSGKDDYKTIKMTSSGLGMAE